MPEDGCFNLENDDKQRDLNKGYWEEFLDGEMVNRSTWNTGWLWQWDQWIRTFNGDINVLNMFKPWMGSSTLRQNHVLLRVCLAVFWLFSSDARVFAVHMMGFPSRMAVLASGYLRWPLSSFDCAEGWRNADFLLFFSCLIFASVSRVIMIIWVIVPSRMDLVQICSALGFPVNPPRPIFGLAGTLDWQCRDLWRFPTMGFSGSKNVELSERD